MTQIKRATVVAMLLGTMTVPAAAKQFWHSTMASVYGGACESGTIGYRGDFLPNFPNSFAELGMGTYMGGLPYMAEIRVLNPATHRRVNLRKRDIGGGSGPSRGMDLWAPAAGRLLGGGNGCGWGLRRVYWRRVA